MDTSEASSQAAGREHRLRRRREALRTSISQTSTRLQEARGRSQTIDAAFATAQHDTNVGGGVLAGAVAFRLFLLLVPLAFFLVFGIGLGADAVSESPSDLARQVGIGGLIAKAATSGAAQSDVSRIIIVVVAGFATLLGAHAALKVIRVVHGLIWSVPVQKLRRSWRVTGIFLGSIVLAFVLSAAIASLGHSSILASIGTQVLFFGITFGLWMFVSWHMPHPLEISWATLVPGAVLVALGTAVMRIATIYWFTRSLSHKSATYGAIGGSLALLFWVYLVGRLIVASVVLDAALSGRNQDPIHLDAGAGTARPLQDDSQESLESLPEARTSEQGQGT